MSTYQSKLRVLYLILFATFSLSGCNLFDDDDDPQAPAPPPPPPAPVVYSYEVTIYNLTENQPFSPPAVIAHDDKQAWNLGMESSVALEKLAEGGDTADFIAQSFVSASAAASTPIGPGAMATLTLEMEDQMPQYLSYATMLVNTNDAFTGVNQADVSGLAVNESMSFKLHAYDAGTEANSESMGTMPGPADGGEGYNSTRDDANFVAIHPGVVSNNDGLSASVLDSSHKFDNPVAKLVITRTR